MSHPTATPSRSAYLFDLIKQSIRGDQQDYTTGSIRKAVVLLAVPMVLEMIMESVFALVDLFFVGKLGKHAVSVVGLTESVLTIIYSLAIGMSMAATAIVARRIGEKNPEGASSAAIQTLMVSTVLILLLSAAGMYWAKDILVLMGAEPEAQAMGANYTRIMMGSSVIIMLLFLINGIFRGAGDASIAMKSLWVANIANIILCPLFINGWGFFPELGVTGAAVATTIGRGIGVIYQLFHLFNGKNIIQMKIARFRAEWDLIKSIVNIAWPATFQFIVASCSWIFLSQLVAETGGSEASAGYQTSIRIVMFFLLPAWGVSNAAATLVGQNLGAKDPARAEASVMKTAKYNAIFMFSVSLIFLIGAEGIVSVFSNDLAVQKIAVSSLRILSAGFTFYGMGMVMVSAFNGAGDTKTPTWINIAGFWFFQIPLAYLLAKFFDLGYTGVFIAVPVSETFIALLAYFLFKKGKWKLVNI